MTWKVQVTPLTPDYEISGLGEAAAIYRLRRRRGETVRILSDCLIAAVAIRAGAAVLHRDRDFTVLARRTPLRIDGPA